MAKDFHLIIGAGHMGKIHAKILRKLGERVKMVDIGFEGNKRLYDELRPKSVIIATPSHTHAAIIKKIPLNIPVFCEKPLITSLKQKIETRKTSLMACNWSFCKHIKNAKELTLYYPNEDPYRDLDYIHFTLLPKLEVKIIFTSIIIASFADHNRIHTKRCNMFELQMKHWLDVINKKIPPKMNFPKALKTNTELLKRIWP